MVETKVKSAVDFLIEWTYGENWKIYVVNEALLKDETKIDPYTLLNEVLRLMYSQEKVDFINTVGTDNNEVNRLMINKIKSPQNINALTNEVHFCLGEKLNVFYGENGSGKSSYIRMFRKLADHYHTNEKQLTILPNAYSSEQALGNINQTVEVLYSIGDEDYFEVIDINQKHSVLNKLTVFDSDSVIPLINNNLTFSILPKGFNLFQKVTKILDLLRIELQKTIEVDEAKTYKIFSDSSFDFIREELRGIMSIGNSNTVKSLLDTNFPYKESDNEVIVTLERQIKDLESSNPKDKITILTVQKGKLTAIVDSLKILSLNLSAENIKKINGLISEYEKQLQEESEYNEKFKKNISYLSKVNDEWLKFIEFGKEYYNSLDNSEIKEGDSCIFCSQLLNGDSVHIIKTNFNHIDNSYRKSIKTTESEIVKYDVYNEIIKLTEEEESLIESEGLLGKLKSTIQLVNRNKELFSKLIANREKITDDVILDLEDIINDINNEILIIGQRIERLTESSVEVKSKIDLLKESKESYIKNRKLHTSLPLLMEWFNLKKLIEQKNAIKRKFMSTTLTQKQSEAFKSIVQANYYQIFDKFAQDLNISHINLKFTPKKGETLRKKTVSSKEYKVSQIMSEGEQKAVAMVELATDLTMRGDFNPILFDDPVTSLDYKRAETIADLIYKLSLDRQVIVFTHNIMFYYYLYNCCKVDKNKDNKFFKVDEIDKLNKGFISESFSGRLENLKEIMGKLRVQEQNINSKGCFGDDLEEALKKAYSDIRTWCELIVEEGFFKSIIRRYEPNIMFTKVNLIKGEFVEELPKVSELFERACRWMAGHSQAVETQLNRATKDSFNEDMNYITDIYNTYK